MNYDLRADEVKMKHQVKAMSMTILNKYELRISRVNLKTFENLSTLPDHECQFFNVQIFQSLQLQPPSIHLNRIFQSIVEGITNQCMANRNLVQEGDAMPQKRQIFQIQIMSGIQSQTQFFG